MKKIAVLGSTGSIGVNALKVLEAHPDKFRLVYISGNKNTDLLIRQAKKYRPEYVIVADEAGLIPLKKSLSGLGIEMISGYDALVKAVADLDADLVLNAIVGSKGLAPTVAALRAGRDVALSNKESLVMAGEQINRLKNEQNAYIFPVDSEHSAMWQCIVGEPEGSVDRLILTGSGGPFRERPIEEFGKIRIAEALAHPNWRMGSKITIDSATMMNKGLELIEAHHLFKVPVTNIDILIHPQSIIHSMVKFRDTSVKAQLGIPDMKIPIQYALSYPERLPSSWEDLDLAKIGQLTFFPPDTARFPALKLAYQAIASGGTYPAVLNVVNEQAVYLFLKGRIAFPEIAEMAAEALDKHDNIPEAGVEDILLLEEKLINYMKEKEEKL